MHSCSVNSQALGLKAKPSLGFSDPARLSILEAVLSGPFTVTEIVGPQGLANPTPPTTSRVSMTAAWSYESRTAALCATASVTIGWRTCFA